MKFLINNFYSLFFSLQINRDGHLAGLMEAKPEALGKVAHIEKMRHFTFYNFVFV